MKKICKFSFALLLSFAVLCFGGLVKNTNTKASAAGVVTVYFNAGVGECAVTEIQTNAEGKLDSLPDATSDGLFFEGWFIEVQKLNKVSTNTVFDRNTTLYAGWAEKTFSYTITETSNTYSIKGHTTNEEITYPLATGLATIDNVFSAINAEITDELTNVALNFVNISLSSQLVIPYTNFTLSGNLTFNVADSAIKATPTTAYSAMTFKNLTVAGSCKNYVDIVSTTLNTDIVFDNCEFSATTTDDYGFSTLSAYYSVFFKSYFNHSSTYLYTYVDGLRVYMEDALADGSRIVETTIHTHWREEIVKRFNKANLDNFTLLPLANFYDIEILTNDASLRACSYIKTTFSLNGGSFKTGFETPRMYYKPELPITLPTAENIELAHYNFLGFVASIEFTDAEKTTYGLSSNKYYFNKAQLEQLALGGFDYTLIETLFAKSIPETTEAGFFTIYAYDYAGTNINFLTLKFFADLAKTATFEAVYEDIEYKISFVTNTSTPANDFVANFGETIVFPTLEKEGHSFAGWFEDEELTVPFTSTTMLDTEPTIFAKWTPNTYQITLHHNDNTTDTTTIDVVFGEPINLPIVSYTGHVIVAYFENSTLTTLFEAETMPSHNLDIYIKWDLKRVRIHLDSRCAAILDAIIVTYGETITPPPAPNNPGYAFLGWYTSTAYETPFDFSVMPEKDTIAYARWIQNTYTITFNSNGGSIFTPITKYFGETLPTLGIPVKKNHTFNGWFTDEDLTQAYNYTTMPNQNLTLYAKWTAKEVITISTNPQTFRLDQLVREFIVHENIDGFDIRYFIDGEWTTARPQKVGSYNVKIFRAEDDTYAEVSLTIKNGYVLNNKILELLWLAITLYVLFIIEIVLVVVLRKLRHKKINDFISLSVVLPFGIISTSQFVMVLTGMILALFGFILIIYELVKLHRTVPNDESKPSDYDNSVNIRKMVDKSEDKQIDTKVDELLKTKFAEYDYSLISSKPEDNQFDDETIAHAQIEENEDLDSEDSLEDSDKN